eukprot:c46528_g1_i1 orf=68-247(+)
MNERLSFVCWLNKYVLSKLVVNPGPACAAVDIRYFVKALKFESIACISWSYGLKDTKVM